MIIHKLLLQINGFLCWDQILSPSFNLYQDIESTASGEYLACGIRTTSSTWNGMNGVSEVSVVYCHEFNWANQLTSNLKGNAASATLISCNQDEYIKGVNVKQAHPIGPTDYFYGIRDGGATFAANYYYSGAGESFTSPLLGVYKGFHNACDWYAKWTMTMPGGLIHIVERLLLQKRGDGCCGGRVITKVKIEYLDPSGTLVQYNGGAYLNTGQTDSTGIDTILHITFTPFEASEVYIIIDSGGTLDSCIHGRFDFNIARPIYPAINQIAINCEKRYWLTGSYSQ